MASSYSKYLLIGLPVVALAGFAAVWWQRNGRRRNYEEIGRVSGLFIYPVKSCKGIGVSDIKCVKEGMEFDRRWILLDENEAFVSQRKDPKLALVVPHFEDDKFLCLNAPGMEMLKLNIELQTDKNLEHKRIRVFRNYGEGQYVGNEAAEWFSKYLDKPGCKMYQLSKPRVICEDEKWGDVALPEDKAAFGDFAPYMIANEASLVAVNEELPSPVSMERFRPNVVVSGPEQYGEDKWVGKMIKVGEVEFRFLKHCGRCLFTTVNPATGEKEGDEPLATLRRIRLPEDRDPRQGLSPRFGVHVAPEGGGVGHIKLGDSVMLSV